MPPLATHSVVKIRKVNSSSDVNHTVEELETSIKPIRKLANNYGHSEQGGMINDNLNADYSTENDFNARDSTLGVDKSP